MQPVELQKPAHVIPRRPNDEGSVVEFPGERQNFLHGGRRPVFRQLLQQLHQFADFFGREPDGHVLRVD